MGRSIRSTASRADDAAALFQALGLSEELLPTLDLLTEPRGADYRALLQFLAARATSFSLVWRSDGAYGPSADVVRGRLAADLVRTEGTSAWPGTQYLGGLATVRHYRNTAAAIAVLSEAGMLYAWRSPELPEDLAFYNAAGHVLFASIAHEGDSWFDLAEVSEAEVREALPGLRLRRNDDHGAER